MIQEFIVKGEAIPAKRPRTAIIGGRAVIYKTTQDKEWQASIARQVAASKAFRFKREIPVKFIFFAFYNKPKKHTYSDPISSPIGDLDNISKNLQDALQERFIKVSNMTIKQNGLCFEDDAQIVALIGRKYYTTGRDYVIIRVSDEIDNYDIERLDYKCQTE